MRRRDFLGAIGVGAVAALAGSRNLWSQNGTPWGEFPTWAQSLALPANLQPKNVLEIMIRGGASPWEGFYCLPYPAYGQTDSTMWWTFQSGPDGLPAFLQTCTGSAVTTLPFAEDALGTTVHLGPLTDPFRQRADLVGRLRTLVMSHGFYPHLPALILANTGSSLSSPRCAGMGAAVQRRELAKAGKAQGLPWSYVLFTDQSIFPGADSVGQHPSATRPLSIKVDDLGNVFQGLWEYNKDFGQDANKAVLADALNAQATQRMTRPGEAVPVRAPVLAELSAAKQQVGQAISLLDIVTPELLASGPGSSCGINFTFDPTYATLAAAVKLLNLPKDSPRYVIAQDCGFVSPAAVQLYDFHENFVQQASAKMPIFFSRLNNVLAKPGETSLDKINLDETLVVLNTEFGRSPELVGTGRRHYPTAYTVSMLGGPIGAAQKGIVGAIDKNALPYKPVTPAELRMSLLYAMGIWPFETDLFSYTEVTDANSEQDALIRLRTEILGVPL